MTARKRPGQASARGYRTVAKINTETFLLSLCSLFMRRRFWLSSLLALGVILAASLYSQHRLAAAPALAADMPSGTSFLVLLGVGDKAVTVWDGAVSLTGGSITAIQGWRFG